MTDLDIIVIGGGIIGSGIARDAALRGLKVALFEKEDFGAGTTSRSTRLIHGGLRYLQHLDFGLVRDDLRERERLLKNAPHLVKPLPFLVPIYRRGPLYRLKLRVGMLLYDLLSYDKSLPRHRMLSRAETLALEPGLNPDGLQGAALYYDAQISSPERLCIENILDAEVHGAQVFNHTEVVGAIREGDRIVGVRVRKRMGVREYGSGEAETGALPHSHTPIFPHAETEYRASVIVNASGPWFDALAGLLTGQESRCIRRTKGIHFAAPSATRHAIVLFSNADQRLFFLIPWLGYTWVGTTDTDFDGDPVETYATDEEVAYLLQDARHAIPNAPWDTIYFTQAGVRALVRNDDGKHASAVSRKHLLVDHAETNATHQEGLISVLGGKITAYRSIAEGAVDLICKKIGCERKGQTAARPLPGGRFDSLDALRAECEARCAKCGLSPEQARHLVDLYGARYVDVLDRVLENPSLAASLHPAYPDIRAQIHDAVLREHSKTASDFLMRRSLLFFTPDRGRAVLDAVIAEMAALCDWDEARCEQERMNYRRALSLSAAPKGK